MTERITPAMVSATMIRDLGASLAAMTRSSDELSSGRKILKPSDDPYGASHALQLQSQLDGLSSYASAIQDGTAWTQTATDAMANISDLIQRVRQLAVEAANGTSGPEDLGSMAAEVTQLTEAVKQDANTQFAGQYIFSGTATTTAPYATGPEDAYNGNGGTIARTIGPSSSVTVNADLASVLGSGQAAGDGKLIDTLRTIAQHMNEATPASREALGADMKNLDGNLESLTAVAAQMGSTTQQMQAAADRVESLQTSITAALSSTEDANLAQTSIAYSNEQAAYSAALRAAASIVQESLLNFLH